MGKETKRNLEDVLEAIKGSYGIKRHIAKRLGVSRPTVDKYLQRWVRARIAYESETKTILDLAESVVVANLKLQSKEQEVNEKIVDTSDARWVLRMKDDSYSPKERREYSGPDGGPIEYNIIEIIEYDEDE